MTNLPANPIPRQDEIIALLQAGIHPVKVSRAMAKKGTQISPEEIALIAVQYGISDIISPMQKLIGVDKITDPIQDLHNLVIAEEERLVSSLLAERETGKISPSNNMPINQLFRHLKELAELELAAGISIHQAASSGSDQPRSAFSLRELLEGRGTVTVERITVDG